jgi:hypothetical protein
VGFSAVLFALKYILTWNEPGFSQPMGLAIVLPTKYLAWAGEVYGVMYAMCALTAGRNDAIMIGRGMDR